MRMLGTPGKLVFSYLPNVKDEPRPCLARLVLLGARGVTDRVVGSGAWFGSVVFQDSGKVFFTLTERAKYWCQISEKKKTRMALSP